MNRQFRVGPARRLAVAAAGTLLACAVAAGPSISHAANVKKADDTSLTGPLVALENGAAVFEVKPEKGGGKPERTAVPLADIVEIKIDPAVDGGAKGGAGKNDKQEHTAAAAAAAAAAAPGRGPVNVFDGKSLDGWKGDTEIWTVKDGAITGASENSFASGPEHVAYLVYAGGDVEDFELRYRFKVTGGTSNSSGVMFRAQEVETDGEKDLVGLQQDIGWPPAMCGQLLDTSRVEGRQRTRAQVGLRATYKDDVAERETAPLAKIPQDLNEKLKENEWNEAVLAVKGGHFVSMINGEVFAEVIDTQKASPRKGKLALQFGRRAPMTVQFKDLRLRKLGPADVPETPGVTWEASPAAPAEVAKANAEPAAEASKAAAANAAESAKVAAAEAAAAAAATKPVGAKVDANAEQQSAAAAGKVKKIFDGQTLKGWEGDEDVWSVQGNVITGKVDENNQNNRVTYLTYTAEEFSDFQLSLTFKITGGQRNSGGVQFRSKVVENGDAKDVSGYQQDWGHVAGLSGQIVDSGGNVNGQPLKSSVGERAIYDAQGNRSVVPLGESAEDLNGLFKADDWNDATLVVRGNHVVSMINGHIFAEAINELPSGAKKGVIAFQISRRQVMTVEIKNLSLRTLGPKELPKVKGVDWVKVLNERQVTGASLAAKGDEAKGGSDTNNAKNVTAAWQARLAGGDQITGELLGWDDKALKLKSLYGEVSIPVKQLREVWHGSNDEIEKARAAVRSAGGGSGAATEDTAFARKDDQVIPVNGLVRSATTDSLNFRFQDADKQIKLEKLVGVTLAVAEDTAADDALQQSLVFASGDVVSGQWTALENGSVTLKTSWGDTLKVPVKSFDRIRTKNGRLVFVSDLAPAAVEQTPYFDRMLAFRADKSLTGTPIKLADGEHAKGLSVHSRTLLRYDIGRKYEKFRAKLGFQQPEGKGGRVAVRVLGDNDKVLHEVADARGDQPPADVDLNVSGVSRLTLEVDFGDEQDVGDRFVWADARLLRRKRREVTVDQIDFGAFMLGTNRRVRSGPSPLTTFAGLAIVLALLCLTPIIARAQKAVFRVVPAPAAAAAPTTGPASDVEDERNTPATGPTTRRVDLPKGSFELVEWVVLLVDPNRTNANDAASFKSTWPGFARGRRAAPGETPQTRVLPRGRRGAAAAAPAQPNVSAEALKNPSPAGVIRLFGKGAEDDSIDVLLQVPNGRFLQYWPQGKPKSNRQLWEKVALKAGPMQPVPADAGSWFETLRRAGDGAGSLISTQRWTERFLMYDAEFPYPNVLKLKAAGSGSASGSGSAAATAGKYQLANAGAWPMRDVEVYSPAPGGWRVSGLKELASSKPRPTTQKSGSGSAAATAAKERASTKPTAEVVKQVFAEKAEAASTKPAKSATSRPATQPTTKPDKADAAGGDVPKDAWRDLAIAADAKALSAEDAVAPWRTRLTDAGLTPADVDVVLATLRTQALDDEQLTVVYRMDPAELDKLLPLEVVPLPAKTTRVGLAIVINIDPAAGERIAKLIQQMGDPDWSKREAAYAKLTEIGAGAKPKLTEATKNPDIEIVYRAERLLDAINNPQ